MKIVMGIILFFFFFGVPAILSVINGLAFLQIFTGSNKIITFVRRNKLDALTIVLGILFSTILWSLIDFRAHFDPIQISVDLIELHEPISSEHMLTVIVFIIIGYILYIPLKSKYKEMPPLRLSLYMCFVVLSNIVGFFIIIQFAKHLFIDAHGQFSLLTLSTLFVLLPINFFFLSTLLLRDIVEEYVPKPEDYSNKMLIKLSGFIIQSRVKMGKVLILLLPIYVILTMILVLFGQKPDSLIQAFTKTSDWTLSKEIAPPSIQADGHYLCTVSLRGHGKLVKPIRYGIRGGEKIVVNRQLMVANAFEDWIHEKYPKAHKCIRTNYDKYGYPLSKVITSKFKADLVYVLMKPLEYFFLLILYTFDRKPENRIAMQYLPVSVQKDLRIKTQRD